MRDATSPIQTFAAGLAEVVSLTLFIGMIAVWAAVGSGA